MEELLHPLVKVPFEKANKSFRLFHKHVTREVLGVQKTIQELQAEQPPAQHAVVEETIQRLQAIAERIRSTQKETKKFIGEQHHAVETCVLRTQHSRKQSQRQHEQKSSTSQAVVTSQGAETGEESDVTLEDPTDHDRLIADYLLYHGYMESSKVIQETKGIEFMVDHDVHLECRSILNDLHARNVVTAIEWCVSNASRLRRLQSRLEFQLRLQEFIELVRSDKKLEAIMYAQTNLTPISMQHENEEIKKSMMESIQEAMATLAYKSPDQCGVETYSRLFSNERWQSLKELFRSTFCEVYGFHSPPSLCIALHAGVSTLNTRTCRRTREARAFANASTAGKDGDEVESSRETSGENKRQSDSTSPQRSKKTKVASSQDASPSQRRKLSNSSGSSSNSSHGLVFHDDSVPLCPTCSDVGAKLTVNLPFAHHPHSRLVCRVTQRVMDEHNPPVVLPNGFVYSQQAIDQLMKEETQTESSLPMITCPETLEMYNSSDLKPVFIL
ncbi:hypothetical protein Poli38472_002583 [Pythium oligandrum]|uniref:Macrophage erythroblast attacher n=1 Tax=Pythium oligandrum TaxID=41045 RepID=A0A8K1CK04_PYTOL|nr:hypothetical protein Poli38472_002583 [Pythium oligandrum]|eukprot:TMW63642.1 hypothetical protein Poli38472_002583 [Pythium oligandrum]